MPIDIKQISALILAGGKSRRFNSVDKGLVHYLQKPMVQHVIERIAPQVSGLAISCNQNSEQYEAIIKQSAGIPSRSGLPICIPDSTAHKFCGPLAGINAYFHYCQTEYVFVCPCDTPLVPRDIVDTLGLSLMKAHAVAAYPVHKNQTHHLMLLIKRIPAAQSLETLLSSSSIEDSTYPSVKAWLAELGVCEVPYPDNIDAFININSATELKSAENSDAKHN